MDQDRLFHTLVVSCISPTRLVYEGDRDDTRSRTFSPLDNKQLVRTSADGTRPHRAGESRGRDPRVERTHTVPPPSSSSLTDTSHTALVPPPLIPPPLQPSLGRSDEPVRRSHDHRASLRARARPRARPPLRARRHLRTRQVLGRRCARVHRCVRRAPPSV